MKSTAKIAKSRTVGEGLSRTSRDGQVDATEEFTSRQQRHASLQLLPRVIRLKDAPGYLGVDKNRFNREIRPGLVAIPIGKQGVAFDRLDLDLWWDEYKKRNGRPGQNLRGNEPWDVKKHRDSSKGAKPGTSTKLLTEIEFAAALARATSKKRKGT